MIPTSGSYSCNKIAIDYTLADGKTESIETRVVSREKGVATYEDKVASG